MADRTGVNPLGPPFLESPASPPGGCRKTGSLDKEGVEGGVL
jgi:hypothetical protein